MAGGYIKAYRQLQEHWLWMGDDAEPFDRRSAWLDLLMLATYKDTKALYRGALTVFERGVVYKSIAQLATRWEWDRKKVRRFLVMLEEDGMITRISNNQGTIIKISNYDKWQGTADGTDEPFGITGMDYIPHMSEGTAMSSATSPATSLATPHKRRNKEREKGEEYSPPLPPSRGGRKKMRRLDDGSDDGDDYTAMLRKQLEEEMF